MVRQHPDADPSVACIWPTNSSLNSAVGVRLLCWANGFGTVQVQTNPGFHYEVSKALCGVAGALAFTDGGPNQCPLGDDLTVAAATPLDADTCGPPEVPDDELVERLAIAEAKLVHALYDNVVQTYTQTLTFDAPDDQTTGLIINQDNAVTPSVSADLFQVFYQGLKTFWGNEGGLPRIERFGSEILVKLFPGADTTHDILQVIDPIGTVVSRIGGGGGYFAPNINVSPWTNLTIDSPTVPGKYVAHVTGDGWRVPGVRLTNGGDILEFRGRIDVPSPNNITNGDIIATALPILGSFNNVSNVNMAPSQNVRVVCASAGAAVRIEILSDSRIRCLATLASVTSFDLDNIRVARIT